MQRNLCFALIFCLVALVGLLAPITPTMAASFTVTNNTPGSADGSTLTRTVTVNPGDLPLGATLSNVRVAIDFDKIDALSSANCGEPSGSGDPWNDEMFFYLTSPAGTKVVLVESEANGGGSGLEATYPYPTSAVYNGPYSIVFDDAAPSIAGPVPLSGTFKPAQPLSAFEGESPVGTWTLTIGDDMAQDPVCFSAFSLELTDTEFSDLVLDKTGPTTVVAGEPITYTVVVTNTGPAAAPLVEILDNPPDEISFVNATVTRSGSGPAGQCAYATCQAANVSVGEVLTMTLDGVVDPGVLEDTMLINQATAFASGDLEPDSSDSTTTTVRADADLSVDKVALANTVAPGEGLLYQIAVANDGPSDAQGVRVVDTLDPNTTFAAASPGCSYDSNTHQVTCDLGQIAADSTSHILLAVVVGQVSGSTELSNHVAVSSDTSDPDAGNNVDVETTNVVQESEPDANLVIAKVAEPATVVVGELITYQVTITNTGPLTATNIEVLEYIPNGTTVLNLAADNPDFDNEFCTQGSICYLGRMEPGTTAHVTVTLRVDVNPPADTLTNVVAVIADEPDSEPDNNLAHATVTVRSDADLSVDKVALANTVAPGEGLLYQIAVANDGSSDAQGVRVVDTLDPNTTFAAASPGCSYDSNTHQVTCDLGQMAADSTSHILLAVVVGQVSGGTELSNHVAVSSDTSDPDAGNNADTVTTNVVQESEPDANLVIAKVAEPAAVEVGSLITYQLTITNTGPQAATNIEVLELLPNGTTAVNLAADNPDFDYEFCTQGGICYLGRMESGTTAFVTTTLRVDVNLLADSLTNVAAVTADEPDSEPDNNLAHATVTLMPMEYTFFYLPLYVSDTITDALHSSSISPWVNTPCFIASSGCSSGNNPKDRSKTK